MTFVATSGAYTVKNSASSFASTTKLFQVMQIIRAHYVEDVSADTLITGAVKGMIGALNDPHSTYMDKKRYSEFMIETEGSFGGVGIVIGVRDKLLTVVAPIEGTPGEEAGIKSGDQIVKIDGQDTKDMAVDQAVSKIRGPIGSKVTLTITRDGQAERDYVLTRSNIQIRTVSSRMLEDNIGYIRVSMFNEHTGSDFNKKMKELKDQGMRAVVLDLRDNPGGLLNESVKIASNFVPQGPVVSVISKSGDKMTHTSDLKTPSLPLAVLINGGSASASEIVAGAVQDTGVGTLIGTKTYGKGSVQSVMRLDNETAVKLTVARYYTPKNRSIDGVGIEPDLKVELEQIDRERPYTHSADMSIRDTQLKKAIEILKEKI
jgi:carboxyl-terminal processing protease